MELSPQRFLPYPVRRPSRRDLAHLQGTGLRSTVRRAGELFISGRTFTLRFLDNRLFTKETFDLLRIKPARHGDAY